MKRFTIHDSRFGGLIEAALPAIGLPIVLIGTWTLFTGDEALGLGRLAFGLLLMHGRSGKR